MGRHMHSLRKWRFSSAYLVLTITTAVGAGIARAQTFECTAQPQNMIIEGHRLVAEVACGYDVARGLMGRRALQPDHGMLFIFPNQREQCMWMKNTLIPLSVAFIDMSGRVTNIEDMQPQTTQLHCSREAVRYALEMQQGWFAQRGVKPGSKISLQ